VPWFSERAESISRIRLEELVDRTVEEARHRICAHPRRVLLLPPDITRAHCGAGPITQMFYRRLEAEAEVYVMPTLGQHVPHTREENVRMFGAISADRILEHNWRNGCVRLGEISADFVREATGGIADWPIPFWLDRQLIEQPWDLIINIGQVVPHESLGFAGHNKNYFIGLGGKETICAAHLTAGCCGVENNMGTITTPVRECFNKAEDEYLRNLPDLFVQLVLAPDKDGELVHTGVYVGDDRETYIEAARQSREQNIIMLDHPLDKIVCVMHEDTYSSTWVANKAIYRTRMALADDGELIVIAPGLRRFGESPEVDGLIRKYGYTTTAEVLQHYRRDPQLQQFAHAAAHLMDSSPEDRFSVTYAQQHLSREEIEGVRFRYADLRATLAAYRPETLRDGVNELPSGERVFFLSSPASGLWSTKAKLFDRPSRFQC
jgi:nickel-dependent lactate racemase